MARARRCRNGSTSDGAVACISLDAEIEVTCWSSFDCALAIAGMLKSNSSMRNARRRLGQSPNATDSPQRILLLYRSGVCVGKRSGVLLGEPLTVLLPAGKVARTRVRVRRGRGNVFERAPMTVGSAPEQLLIQIQVALDIAFAVVRQIGDARAAGHAQLA